MLCRINYYVVLTVTDAQGNTGRDIIFLTQNNFPATNAAPVPVIAVSREYSPPRDIICVPD